MILGNFDLNSVSNRITLTGVLFVVIFAFGVVLTRSGSPYSTVLLTVHKLASVAAFILLIKAFVSVNQTTGLNTLTIIVGVIAGLAFIGTIATGGIITIGGDFPEIVYTLHRAMPILTLVFSGASLYLLYYIK
ncbi:MAG: hypothetical protein NWF07_11595 [Candidatus Bathyarchaeota archaeon]|nr:hypothetical protein [Candidatus Bathyarchaeota archaeon]